MLTRWFGWAVAGMAVVTLMGAAVRPAAPQRLEARPEVGFPAPDFTLQTLDGQAVSLADFRGKTVFVNFWATWCGPCRLEMPEMKRLHEKQIPNLVILAVNMTDTERSAEHVRQFMDHFEYRFTTPLDQDGRVARQYNVVSIPTSYFVGPDGIIKAKHMGPMTLATMERYVDRAGEAK